MSENTQRLAHGLSQMKRMLDGIPGSYHFKMQTGNDFLLPGLWTFSGRINDCFHMAYVRSGWGYYALEQDREFFERGKVLLVSSGMPHSRVFDSRDPPRMALLRFWLCRNDDGQPVESESNYFGFGLVPPDAVKYSELITRLIAVFHHRRSECDEKQCGAILLELFCELYRDGCRSLAGESRDIRLQRALDRAAERENAGVTVGEMAAAAGVSANHLRTLFKRDMGMTPKQYLMERRIRQARLLLTESDCTVRTAAELLGYPDPYTFSKQFKAVRGYPPSRSKKP